MNIQKNIIAIQIAYDLIYQENLNRKIINYNPSYIICIKNNKLKIKNYKNFLIYLTNYYYLTDIIDKTNLTFKKFFKKLEIFL